MKSTPTVTYEQNEDFENNDFLVYGQPTHRANFHALRHTTGSWLSASGVHPKVAQQIMRHSTINMTMNIYTHTLAGQETAAIMSLPSLSVNGKLKHESA